MQFKLENPARAQQLCADSYTSFLLQANNLRKSVNQVLRDDIDMPIAFPNTRRCPRSLRHSLP